MVDMLLVISGNFVRGISGRQVTLGLVGNMHVQPSGGENEHSCGMRPGSTNPMQEKVKMTVVKQNLK